VNLDTKRGTVYDGNLFLSRKNFHITGNKAEKIGEEQYRIYDATLTSCDADVPPWKFGAKELDVRVEGYATAKWPAFYLRNVPILIAPWSMFPVKTERQSGFLIPEFSSSSTWGPEITIPFYWAIAPNHDATFYLQRIGDERGRGFKEGIEYRYAWSSRAEGSARGFYIWDEREDEERWSVFYDHDQRIGNNYYLKADVNLVSDREYPVDFDEDLPDAALIDSRSRNQLETNVAAGKIWDWGVLDTEFSYIRDLTVESNRFTLQRLPQLTFEVFQHQFRDTPFFYEFGSQGTYFWRRDGIRGGRMDVHPRVAFIERPLGVLRGEVSAGYRETVYIPDNDPSRRSDDVESRELYDIEASLATTLNRIYTLGRQQVVRIRHTIEPEITFSHIPDVNQDNNPQFDDLDTIDPLAAVTYGLTSRVMGKVQQQDGTVRYPEYLYVRVYQSYDVNYDFENGEQLSNVFGDLDLRPCRWMSGNVDLEYNPHEREFDAVNTGLALADNRGDRVGIDYRFSKDNVEELNADLTVRVLQPLDLFVSYRHNLRDDVRIDTVYGLNYRHQCWELSLRFNDINKTPDGLRDDELKITVLLTLSGIGTIRY
jgi:LPS-assembly protein